MKTSNMREYARNYARKRRATPEGKAELARSFNKAYAKPYGRALRLFHAARKRARETDMEFTIVLDDVLWPILFGKCQVTGASFDFLRTDTRRNPWAPSIDRRDNSRGYTKDNVQIVCTAHNMAKNEWDEKILRQYVMLYAAVILEQNGILKRP